MCTPHMKQQVVHIHGGEAFDTYDAFLEYLETTPISDPTVAKPLRWTDTLRADLGEAYEVYQPTMPNKQNAQYREWKRWFARFVPYFRDGVVLVGHSLGGIFLVKYLSETSFPVRIHTLVLLGAPNGPDDFDGEGIGDFAFDTELAAQIVDHVDHLIVAHSTDDPVVPYAHAEGYHRMFPKAEQWTFSDRGHFLDPAFPELLTHIREIY